jgi:acyl-homoserine lactone acylase PvdQ
LSTEQDKIRTIADRIAQRLAGGDGAQDERRGGAESDELTQLRAALRELQQRLAHVESHVAHGDDCAQQHGHGAGKQAQATARPQGASPQPQRVGQQFSSSTYVPAVHPSQERFGIDDAVSELVDFFEREKVCSVEPGEKPCDQCGMCSARGF